MNDGIICKDKNIEKYALENYGRLSGMTTIGIIITALTEYQPKEQEMSDENKPIVDYDGLCGNINSYVKRHGKMNTDFLKELFAGYVEFKDREMKK